MSYWVLKFYLFIFIMFLPYEHMWLQQPCVTTQNFHFLIEIQTRSSFQILYNTALENRHKISNDSWRENL